MTRPIIGMDIDDVLADFIKAFMFIAHELFGVDPNVRPTSWAWDGTGLTPEQLKEVWKIVSNTRNFHLTLSPVPGLDTELMQLMDEKTKIYFPTARFETPGADVGKQSAHWLAERVGFELPTVFVSSEKGEMAKLLKYAYFIDDRPKNCLEVKAALPDCKVYLCDSCHNKDFESTRLDRGGPNIPRIANVNDFARIVLADV